MDASEVRGWQKDFLEFVDQMPDEVKYAEDVNVTKIQHQNFQDCTRSQLSKFVRNIKEDARKRGMNFRDVVRNKLDRLEFGNGVEEDQPIGQKYGKSRKKSRKSSDDFLGTEASKDQWTEDIYSHFEMLLKTAESKENKI